MTVSVDDFKKALQCWASGVAVVTTQSEEYGIQGMTVTSFASVSLEPPQILVCINEAAETGAGIQESGYFAVNILTAEQEAVSNQFAGGSSMVQRFAATPWSLGAVEVPLLTDSIVSLECKLVSKLRAGTHWIMVGEVQHTITRSGAPLLYYASGYRQLAEKN